MLYGGRVLSDQPLGEEGYFNPHICKCGNKCMSARCTKCGEVEN